MSARNGNGTGSSAGRSRFAASRCPSRWFTPTSGRRRRCAMPFATVRPTRSEPTSPGPRVTAMPSTSPSATPARPRAASITGRMFRTWWRDASSGTTPPYGPCTASCDDTTDARSAPSRRTAAAESSQELSTPRTITGRASSPASPRRLDGEEDRVVAAPDEEEHALPLPDRLDGLPVGLDVLHRLPVHLEDDVAAPEPCVRRGPARVDLGHHYALQVPIEAEILGEVAGEGLDGEPEVLGGPRPRLRGLLLLQLLDLHRVR